MTSEHLGYENHEVLEKRSFWGANAIPGIVLRLETRSGTRGGPSLDQTPQMGLYVPPHIDLPTAYEDDPDTAHV